MLRSEQYGTFRTISSERIRMLESSTIAFVRCFERVLSLLALGC